MIATAAIGTLALEINPTRAPLTRTMQRGSR
jgi:hypothetical protein